MISGTQLVLPVINIMAGTIELQRGIITGVIAGAIWGIFTLCISSITQLLEFDFSFFNGIVTFSVAGMGLGLVAGALYSVIRNYLPFQNEILKGGFLSTAIWLIFFVCSLILSGTSPERYHFHNEQSLQGLILSVFLGVFIGLLWKSDKIRQLINTINL
ncbi:MAG: hypothetical protein HQK84_04075 [Nitrospinae bacterium]|nr:hypothetical protein [Nitrospinota bacterium]